MSLRKSRRERKMFNDINMTPLIDLTFLLLITFIITMPALEQGITVKLPQGKTDTLPKDKPLSISLDVEGKVH